MDYEIYVCDTETTGLDFTKNSPIEISFIRVSTNEQKTWKIKAMDCDVIDPGALKVNGHSLEDITHKTKFGIDNYLLPNKAIIEIENWITSDDKTSSERVLCGQNIAFDKYMLEFFWKKNNSFDSFPFGRRTIDTFQLEFVFDMAMNSYAQSYSLSALTKKYGIKNEKAHSAEADTKATKLVFDKQIANLIKLMNK